MLNCVLLGILGTVNTPADVCCVVPAVAVDGSGILVTTIGVAVREPGRVRLALRDGRSVAALPSLASPFLGPVRPGEDAKSPRRLE